MGKIGDDIYIDCVDEIDGSYPRVDEWKLLFYIRIHAERIDKLEELVIKLLKDNHV